MKPSFHELFCWSADIVPVWLWKLQGGGCCFQSGTKFPYYTKLKIYVRIGKIIQPKPPFIQLV